MGYIRGTENESLRILHVCVCVARISWLGGEKTVDRNSTEEATRQTLVCLHTNRKVAKEWRK